jgi:hypothetical protein
MQYHLCPFYWLHLIHCLMPIIVIYMF